VRKRLEKSSGIKADFYMVTGDKPNAFATNVVTGRNLFAINLPMINELGDDIDALAYIIGHELAHIERNHLKVLIGTAQNVNAAAQVVSILLAIAGVPASGVVSGMGANLVMKGYSREQEREADAYGLRFAREAGFNPYGAVRLINKMSDKQGDKWLTFWSNHPSLDERLSNMSSLIKEDMGEVSSQAKIAITKLELPSGDKAESGRASVMGEYSPTVFDGEERAPTLHRRVKCKLEDGTYVSATQLHCVQQGGKPLINER
jgi:predicted Zn-dependent protease